MAIPVDENAIKQILANEEFSFFGEARIRLVAQVYEQLFQGNDLKFYGFSNSALRKELWRLLGDDIRGLSETRVWMIVRRYRDHKRKAIVDAEAEVQRKVDEEAAARKAEAKAKAAEARAKAKAAADTEQSG